MKQIFKKIILTLLLFLHSQNVKAFKLDRVIISTDTNKTYMDFWPLVAKAWTQIVGIKPTLAFIADDDVQIDETLGDVIRFKPIPGVPTALHAQVIRFLLPAYFEDEVCLLSDIDMLPMQKDYYHDSVKDAPNDAFVVYRDYLATSQRFPICYVAAKGKTFKDLFNIPSTDFIPFIIKKWAQLDWGWSTDEILLTSYLESWNESSKRLIKLGQTGNNRIDRWFWFYDTELVKAGHYVDAHMIRPYTQYKDELDTLAHYIGLTEYKPSPFLRDASLRQGYGGLLRTNGDNGENKHFEIVIPSYNNKKWCVHNLFSAIRQNYPNFHVYYIDDASTDGTGEIIEQLIKQNNLENKVTLIRNKKRAGCPLANFYKTIHMCDDRSIIVQLDGDDFLAHENVLNKLNEVYSDPDVWLTYGSHVMIPQKIRGPLAKQYSDETIKNNAFRSHYFLQASHLRTNYAWLFKQIKYEDFLVRPEKFFQMAGDMFLMFPMLEMAGFHSRYLHDLLYVYNVDNPLNEYKVDDPQLHKHNAMARGKQPYQPLSEPMYGADLIVFSYDRPLQLYAFLESARKYLTGVNSTQIIYRTSDNQYEQAYTKVKEAFESATFIKQENAPDDFKRIIEQAINIKQSDYVIFAVDDIIITDYVNLAECVNLLRKTNAYAFYLRLGKNITHLMFDQHEITIPAMFTPIHKDKIAWQFPRKHIDGIHPWAYAHSLDMTLYPKALVKNHLAHLEYHSPNTLESLWRTIPATEKIGLCFEHSKIVNIPFNCVQDEFENPQLHVSKEVLLDVFNKGAKLNIHALYKHKNKSPYIVYKPTFARHPQ